MDRMSTPAGRLARRGFGDPHHAVTVIEPWIERCEDEALIRRLVDGAGRDEERPVQLTDLRSA